MNNLGTPTTATIKRIFALSGNRCAFPKCESTLVDGEKVVGKICHIKARNEGGPRFDPNQTPEERHGYDNLILMCGRHHDVIDADEEAYTVEYLHRLKTKHEQSAVKLSEREAEQGAKLLILDQSVSSVNQSGGMTAHTINIHNFSPSQPPKNELARLFLRTRPGSQSGDVKTVQLSAVLENISDRRKITDYVCTLSVPKACLTHASAAYLGEIRKEDEPNRRFFRVSSHDPGRVAMIFQGDKVPLFALDLGVDQLRMAGTYLAGDYEGTLLDRVIAEAVVEGELLRTERTIADIFDNPKQG